MDERQARRGTRVALAALTGAALGNCVGALSYAGDETCQDHGYDAEVSFQLVPLAIRCDFGPSGEVLLSPDTSSWLLGLCATVLLLTAFAMRPGSRFLRGASLATVVLAYLGLALHDELDGVVIFGALALVPVIAALDYVLGGERRPSATGALAHALVAAGITVPVATLGVAAEIEVVTSPLAVALAGLVRRLSC